MKPLRIVVKNVDEIRIKPDELSDWFFNTLIDNGFDPKQPVIVQPILGKNSVEYIQYRFFWRWVWNIKIPLLFIAAKRKYEEISAYWRKAPVSGEQEQPGEADDEQAGDQERSETDKNS